MRDILSPLEIITKSDNAFGVSFEDNFFSELDQELFYDYTDTFKHNLEYYFSGEVVSHDFW